MSLTPKQMYDWWDGAAKSNAMTAILSNEQSWDEQAFFRTGREWLAQFSTFASMAGVELGGDVALDFGCGLGRMTQALADIYQRAIGIDISDEMVRLAQKHSGLALVEYLQVSEPPFPLADRSVDLSFSTIVIQHIPTPHNLRTVEELFRVSRKAVLFDAPSHKLRPDDPDPTGGIFLLGMNDVMNAAHSCGFQLAALRYFPVTATRHYQYLFVTT